MPRTVTEADLVVAKKIRTLRILAKISQESLAAAVGTSFQQIQKYETGVNRISIGMLVSIAKALNLSVTEFVDDDLKLTPDELRPSINKKVLDEWDWYAVALLNETKSEENKIKIIKIMSEVVSLVASEDAALINFRSKIGARKRAAKPGDQCE